MAGRSCHRRQAVSAVRALASGQGYNRSRIVNIRQWPLSRLIPYEKNPRHNADAIEAVARSIKEFGFRIPILVDGQGVIIAGHTRLAAAKQLELEKVPVIVADDLSPEKVRALRIADNATAARATWDEDLLREELLALQGASLDLSMLGFDAAGLAAALAPKANEGVGDENDVPSAMAKATARKGDVWRLGAHRLMCGDSTKPADIDRLLEKQPVHLVNTDPPYNVKVEPRSNNAIAAGLSSFTAAQRKDPSATDQQSADLHRHPGKSKATHKTLRAKDRPLASDFVTDGEFDHMLAAWFGNIARVLVPGGGFYIWAGYANCTNYPPVLKACGLYFSQVVIWIKEHPVLTRKDMMGNHEWCFYGWAPDSPVVPVPRDFEHAGGDAAFYGWREGGPHRWFGPANVQDTWFVKKVSPQSMVHLTEKPVELARRAIEYSSRPGETVLDLFGGSGSTLIACEQTGRRARLMELDEPYCDVIIKRYIGFVGGGDAVAQLVESEDGVLGAWDQVVEARGPVAVDGDGGTQGSKAGGGS